ncbi:unnamed protein product, partial [Mesorhabditis spiculigera]
MPPRLRLRPVSPRSQTMTTIGYQLYFVQMIFLLSFLSPANCLPTPSISALAHSAPTPITFQDYVDHAPYQNSRRRSKRFVTEGSFWDQTKLTWKIGRNSKTLPAYKVQKVIQAAFEVWEGYAGFSYEYTPNGRVHIEIVFAENGHGDDEPFDGRGKILAHAFFPRFGGDIHFDDAENWALDKNEIGVDLYAVAVHEIGHSLGLKHSNSMEAIMAPYYQNYQGNSLYLKQDDVSALFSIYGKDKDVFDRNKVGLTDLKLPDICSNPHLDAITMVKGGKIYAFQGSYFWVLKERGGIESGPLRIDEFWPFEGHIDAALSDGIGHSYFFKDKLYWLIGRDGVTRAGYPKEISRGFTDTPDHIDAAMIWNKDGRPYIFKGRKFWRYQYTGMPKGYPKSIRSLAWGFDFPRIDAALTYKDRNFLFIGNKYYPVTGKQHPQISLARGRLIADDWFGCNGGRLPY